MSGFLEDSKDYFSSKMRFVLFLYHIDENEFDSIYQILNLFNGNPNNTFLHNYIKNELIPLGVIKKDYRKALFGKTQEYYKINAKFLIRFVQADILKNYCWDMCQGWDNNTLFAPKPIRKEK